MEEGAGLSQRPDFAAAALATARGTKRDDTHAQPSTPPTAGTLMPDTSARAVSTWLDQDVHAGESPGHSHNDGSMDASDRAGASFGSARTAHRPAPITGNSVIKPASKKTRVDNVDEHTLLVARMDALVDCPQSVDTAKTFVTTIICPHALTAAPPHGLAAVGMDESMLKESTLHKIESGWKCVEWLCKGPPEKPAPYSLVMQTVMKLALRTEGLKKMASVMNVSKGSDSPNAGSSDWWPLILAALASTQQTGTRVSGHIPMRHK